MLRVYNEVTVKEGDRIGLVFKKTPFFPKRGGQESDIGDIVFKDFILKVDEVIEPVPNLIVHWGTIHMKEEEKVV